MTDRDAERIAVLEANQRHMEAKIDDMATKVQQMHDLLMQAKGAKWVIIGAASIAGFVSAKLGTLAGYIGVKLP